MLQEPASTEELRELYRELILDHARNPRHFGRLENRTHSAEGINPLCGDKLKLYLRIDDNEQIADIQFEGSGCAISVASASLMTDTLAGMHVLEAKDYFAAVTGALSGDNTTTPKVALGKLRALQGVREFPSRIKCATLAWHAMHSALQQDKQTISTE